ncbi:DISARM system phospholipase D-like protein DrmC [Pseudomonas aeruginosa]|nr:DISARM system phospholipase D-like protein DrmC [Pseudomonas aeruginosa]MDF5974541.1 DISARM system phospholipase D-like protein DrmC [Pseudomonas aeruginosa]
MLQVINAAERALFITSFVSYDVSTIVEALNAASDRGVVISMLLELSQDHGGSIAFDAIGKMRTLAPAAKLYAWRDKGDPFSDGRVHAKVAVADGKMCFITSANLTGHAMEKNMEAGVLISGDPLPGQLHLHLDALVMTGVIVPVDD